jgi:anaphase-promoting complex subunit 11
MLEFSIFKSLSLIVNLKQNSSLPHTIGDDVCGICRASFDACPPEAKFPGDDSPVVWGTCSHAFHIQCINKYVFLHCVCSTIAVYCIYQTIYLFILIKYRWLSSQPDQKCPFCRRPWEFKQAEVDANDTTQQRQQQQHDVALGEQQAEEEGE